MKYAGIIKNDFSAGVGTCVTFFTQGCPHKCQGCHNPETWDFNGGKDFVPQTLNDIAKALNANNIKRDFCIMGGEPLCEENLPLTKFLVERVSKAFPDRKIYIWTGYYYEELVSRGDSNTDYILSNIDVLIDGPYLQDQRDITLKMRGSRNQRIIYMKYEEN